MEEGSEPLIFFKFNNFESSKLSSLLHFFQIFLAIPVGTFKNKNVFGRAERKKADIKFN